MTNINKAFIYFIYHDSLTDDPCTKSLIQKFQNK